MMRTRLDNNYYYPENKKKIEAAFTVEIPKDYNKVYIVGNCASLGKWQTYASKRLTRIREGNNVKYVCFIELPVEEEIQYKYVFKRDWTGVECGPEYEELQNRKIYITKSEYEENKLKNIYDEVKLFRVPGTKGRKRK